MKPIHWTTDRIVNTLLYFGGIVLIFVLLNYLSAYILPFLLALLCAYILDPIVLFFQNKLRLKWRWLSVLVVLLLTIGSFIGLIMLISPSIAKEVSKAGTLFETYFTSQDRSEILPENIQDYIQELIEDYSYENLITEENIKAYGGTLLTTAWNTISGTLGVVMGLFGIVSFLLYLVFVMIYYEEFTHRWERIIPKSYRASGMILIQDLEREMKAYFRGQTLIVIIVAILFALGFKIIGLPLAIIFGIFVGLLNYVPYMQLLGLIPAALLGALLAMESGMSIWAVYGMIAAVFLIIQLLQDAFITPKIMGDATGLNPALILLALSIWGGLMGMVGLIIALPITSLILNYYRRFVMDE